MSMGTIDTVLSMSMSLPIETVPIFSQASNPTGAPVEPLPVNLGETLVNTFIAADTTPTDTTSLTDLTNTLTTIQTASLVTQSSAASRKAGPMMMMMMMMLFIATFVGLGWCLL
jgi:hypothetical protein